MINLSTAREAILMAQILDGHGLKLVTEPGTPVGQLASTMSLAQTDARLGVTKQAGDLPVEYAPDPGYIVALSDNFGARERGEYTNYCAQRNCMGHDVANAVRSHMAYAKNVVTPVIEAFVKAVQADVANIRMDADAGYTVLRAPWPAPLASPTMSEHLKSYANVSDGFGAIATVPGEPKTEEELLGIVKAAIPGLQEELTVWSAGLPTGKLQGIYETFFCSNNQTLASAYDVDTLLLIYIFAGTLKDNPCEGSGVSLSEWNVRCDTLHTSAGYRLNYQVSTYINLTELGWIIRNWDSETSSVTVDGALYDAWIEEGGSNGLLFAAVMQRDVPRTAFALGERQVELTSAWHRYLAMTRSAMESNRFMRMKEIVAYRLPHVVRDHSGLIYASMAPVENGQAVAYEGLAAHQEFHRRLREIVPNMRTKDFEDIWMMALDLVCDTVFHFTDAKKILLQRKKAIDMNPDITPAEAEFLARIEYITEYALDQVALTAL